MTGVFGMHMIRFCLDVKEHTSANILEMTSFRYWNDVISFAGKEEQ